MMTEKYDYIFLGTSVICILEAVHRAKQGNKVLMLDNQTQIGGAWETLDLFGLSGVENAIHYFLPDEQGIQFMRECLNWSIEYSPGKYRVFRIAGLGYKKLRYDKKLSNIVRSILYPETGSNLFLYIKGLFHDLFGTNCPSYYLKGGSPEMLATVKRLLKDTDVEVINGINIDTIEIENKDEKVIVRSGGDTFVGETIYFTHGSRIYNLFGNSKPFDIIEKVHLRPSVHLYLEDDKESEIKECIFTSDSLIKYAHNISRFTDQYDSIINSRKLFVLALKHDVRETPDIYEKLLRKLKEVEMVNPNARILDSKWTDVYLPRIDDDDLFALKKAFAGQVEILQTEDFARGVGLNADRWAKTLKLT